jgi:hypothetical protein
VAYLGLETIRRGNTAACVKDIFTLHFPNATKVLDATYGAGRFWKWDHNLTVTGVDIDPPPVEPPNGGLVIADNQQLDRHFTQGEFDVLCYDPPFIFSKGLRRVIGTKRFFMGAEAAEPAERTHANRQLHMPRNPDDLLANYRRIFLQRNLATQGIILKGQDLIVNKPDWWSFHVFNLAKEMGMGEPADILIQHSPAARMRDPRWKNQYNFRRAHCSYIIYKF